MEKHLYEGKAVVIESSEYIIAKPQLRTSILLRCWDANLKLFLQLAGLRSIILHLERLRKIVRHSQSSSFLSANSVGSNPTRPRFQGVVATLHAASLFELKRTQQLSKEEKKQTKLFPLLVSCKERRDLQGNASKQKEIEAAHRKELETLREERNSERRTSKHLKVCFFSGIDFCFLFLDSCQKFDAANLKIESSE